MTNLGEVTQIRHALAEMPAADAERRKAASRRNARLTKPAGALGRLEELAIWHAGWRADPVVDAPQIVVFAANHGIAARGISAYPPEVTAQMVVNFQAGGAAINQLARAAGARLDIHPLDLDRPTADMTMGPAMSEAEMAQAFGAGWMAVDDGADLLVAGEMGIGNTTAASAIAAALLGGDGWAGPGTGLDAAGVDRKAQAVQAALDANPGREGLEVLAALGGREIAAMAGAIAGARARCIPVILDGYICTAAALTLWAERPDALDHAVAGHRSGEGAHAQMLKAMGLAPLLSLGMRLGEGSGAAVAIHVLRAALACQSGMATFEEAGVTDN